MIAEPKQSALFYVYKQKTKSCRGLEPLTLCSKGICSTSWANKTFVQQAWGEKRHLNHSAKTPCYSMKVSISSYQHLSRSGIEP